MNWFTSLLDTLDDKLNPIVVKELRQAVQGRFVIGVLLLFLILQMLVLGFMVLAEGDRATEIALGSKVFVPVLFLLLGACMLLIPANASTRLAAERNEQDMDLFFITTLSPGSIIRGKWMASIILALLIYSACMPFLTFTYLLRGIDIPTIFVILAFGFTSVCLANAVGIFTGCIPASSAFRRGIDGFALVSLLSYFGTNIGLVDDFMRNGVGSKLWTIEFWAIAGTYLLMVSSAIAVLYVFSVALISPPTANRARPVRITLTVIWAATALVVFLWATIGGVARREPFEVWAFFTAMILGQGFAGAVSEREEWGLRVRREIPRNPLTRILTLPFFSGAANGLIWCGSLYLLTLLYLAVMFQSGMYKGYGSFEDDMVTIAAFGFYCMAYALTAAWFRRNILGDLVNRNVTWVVALGLVAFGSTIPVMFGHLLGNFDDGFLSLANPIMSADRQWRFAAFRFAGAWAAFALLISMPWIAGMLERFRPLPLDGKDDDLEGEPTEPIKPAVLADIDAPSATGTSLGDDGKA